MSKNMPTNSSHNRTAAEVHASLTAAVAAWEKAQHNAVVFFAEVMSRELFRELGYSSIQQYARVALGFSETRTGDFVRLARRLAQLPVLQAAVASGEVGYTKAREIVAVATPRTEQRWVDAARSGSRADLSAQVRQARQRAQGAAERRRRQAAGQQELLPAEVVPAAEVCDIPVRVSLEMSPEQYARYEALVAQLATSGCGDRVEAVLQGLAGTLASVSKSNKTNCEESTPRGVPVQVVVHECPKCLGAAIPTNRGELAISRAESARLREDAQVWVDGGRNDAAIAPGLRRAALARDRHTCAAPGCRHTHFLHVHHVVPRALGGGNELENLVTLCAGCHRVLHRRGLGGSMARVAAAD